jgi:hypothetical protein
MSRQPPREEGLVALVPEDLGGGCFKYRRTFPETGSLDRHPDREGAFRLRGPRETRRSMGLNIGEGTLKSYLDPGVSAFDKFGENASTSAPKTFHRQAERILRRAKGGGGISEPRPRFGKTRQRKKAPGISRIFRPTALSRPTRSCAFGPKCRQKMRRRGTARAKPCFPRWRAPFFPKLSGAADSPNSTGRRAACLKPAKMMQFAWARPPGRSLAGKR